MQRHFAYCLTGVLIASTAYAKPTSAPATAPAEDRYTHRDDHDPNGIGKFYMGREIARVMSWHGADWLERVEREDEEQPVKLMAALKIKPGETIVDLGAGSGYYTRRLAEAVGPKGKVLAVEIQQEMLDLLEQDLKQRRIDNVELIRGKVDDPNLPKGKVDLVLMVDVYHEFEFPYEMMQHIVQSLRPGGRVVLVEFRLEDPKVPIKLVHKMSEKQVIKEMSPFPLEHVETNDVLPRQHIIVFKKADKPLPKSRPGPS